MFSSMIQSCLGIHLSICSRRKNSGHFQNKNNYTGGLNTQKKEYGHNRILQSSPWLEANETTEHLQTSTVTHTNKNAKQQSNLPPPPPPPPPHPPIPRQDNCLTIRETKNFIVHETTTYHESKRAVEARGGGVGVGGRKLGYI